MRVENVNKKLTKAWCGNISNTSKEKRLQKRGAAWPKTKVTEAAALFQETLFRVKNSFLPLKVKHRISVKHIELLCRKNVWCLGRDAWKVACNWWCSCAQRQPLKKGMYGLLSHPGSVRLSHHRNITASPTILKKFSRHHLDVTYDDRRSAFIQTFFPVVLSRVKGITSQ